MKIAIRADASAAIGSGHVVRCLTLADVLRRAGATVRWLSRALPAHLQEAVARAGHELVALPPRDIGMRPAEASWPAPLQALDAADCAAALQDWGGCDWLIVDHYAADRTWEAGARSFAGRLLAIDDLRRPHDCDLLLDANLRLDDDLAYADGVPGSCRRLLGPAFALLRPEFAQARAQARPRDGAVRRILVFMGGMDMGNATGAVLCAIDAAATDAPGFTVDVVIGPGHPARAEVAAWCASHPGATCHVDTGRMAQLCAAADLAVGAGGSATWERCALGLPTLALCLADNQRDILHHASRAGLLHAPDPAALSAGTISLHLRALLASSGWRNHLSRSALAAVDALGAERVASCMLQP